MRKQDKEKVFRGEWKLKIKKKKKEGRKFNLVSFVFPIKEGKDLIPGK